MEKINIISFKKYLKKNFTLLPSAYQSDEINHITMVKLIFLFIRYL